MQCCSAANAFLQGVFWEDQVGNNIDEMGVLGILGVPLYVPVCGGNRIESIPL